MIPLSVSDVVSAAKGRLIGEASLLDASITDVVIDSRLALPGTLFVPIMGERLDGHQFIDAARKKGALLTLSDRPLDEGPYILVSDTLAALQDIARFYRSLFPIPVVGVTGSVGKTSIKEMVAAVLGERFCVHKTQGNFNNQTGLPLTVFTMDHSHEVSVVEMGTNHFGEIDRLARIVRPSVCLLSNIGVAHIEFFGSREGIFKGKTEMLDHMSPSGAIIVNGDDDLLATIPGATRYGFSDSCHIRAVELSEEGLSGTSFTVISGYESLRMKVPSPGKHMVLNALAAVAVGQSLGMSLAELQKGVESFVSPAGRMDIRRTARFTVLDDAYNANPSSAMAAIDVLETVPGRRVCILGDMLELGKDSEEFHEVVGMYAAMHGIDLILCVGPNSEKTFLGALELAPHKVRYFETQQSLLSMLPGLLEQGDTVLVKASRGMHLEDTVKWILSL